VKAIEDLNDIQNELVQPDSTDQSGSAANQNNPASASRGRASTLFNVEGKICTSSPLARQGIKSTFEAARQIQGGQDTISVAAEVGIIQGVPKKVLSIEIYPIVVKHRILCDWKLKIQLYFVYALLCSA
jgi:hypothetical protein